MSSICAVLLERKLSGRLAQVKGQDKLAMLLDKGLQSSARAIAENFGPRTPALELLSSNAGSDDNEDNKTAWLKQCCDAFDAMMASTVIESAPLPLLNALPSLLLAAPPPTRLDAPQPSPLVDAIMSLLLAVPLPSRLDAPQPSPLVNAILSLLLAAPLPLPSLKLPSPQALRDELVSLRSQFTAGVPLPVPSYGILKEAVTPEQVSNIFAALGPANKGTCNAIAELMGSKLEGVCKWCDKPFAQVVKVARYVTMTQITKHLRLCSCKPAIRAYEDACRATLAGKPCAHAECHVQDELLPTNQEALDAHLFCHWMYKLQALRNIASRLQTSYNCKFVQLNGEHCPWALRALASGGFDAEKLLLHLETVHAFLCMTSNAVQLCIAHDTDMWLFGLAQIASHHCADAKAALKDMAQFDFFAAGLCPWCVRDDTLPWLTQGHLHLVRGQQKHICTQHLWPLWHARITCAICSNKLPPYNLANHLFTAHSLTLYGDTNGAVHQHTLENMGRSVDQIYQTIKAEWLNWAQALKEHNIAAAAAAGGTLDTTALLQPTSMDFTLEEIKNVRRPAPGQYPGPLMPRYGGKTARIGTTSHTSALKLCHFCQQDDSLPQEH